MVPAGPPSPYPLPRGGEGKGEGRRAVRFLRPLFGIVISGACLFLLARTVALGELLESLRSANPVVLLPAILVYFLGILVRTLRWRALLGRYSVPVGGLFRTLVIGLMVNDVLPGRLGEVARMFLLARNASVPVGASLASIVVERVLDGLALTALLAVGLVWSLQPRLSSPEFAELTALQAAAILWAGSDGWLLKIAAGSAALFGVATACLVWAAVFPGPARWLGYRLTGLGPQGLRERLQRLVDTALSGVGLVARPGTASRVVALSLLAWILEAGMYQVIMVGFQVPGGAPAAFVGMGVANLATLVPSSPGYLGTFDLALQAVLVGGFAAHPGDAASYTLGVHFILIAPVVAAGLVFLWRENLSLPELHRYPRSVAKPPLAG
jgi:uncharacterized membrane protein YbhN (UPF0104 family)